MTRAETEYEIAATLAEVIDDRDASTLAMARFRAARDRLLRAMRSPLAYQRPDAIAGYSPSSWQHGWYPHTSYVLDAGHWVAFAVYASAANRTARRPADWV